jgi:pilus assembly protein CpaC
MLQRNIKAMAFGGAISRLSLATLTVTAVMAAATAQVQAQSQRPINVTVNGGEMIRLSAPAKNVFVANPEVADVQVPSPNTVFILGKKSGSTTVYALGEDDSTVLAREIRVSHNVGELRGLIAAEMPGHNVKIRSVAGALVINGEVRTPQQAERVVAMAQGFVAEGENVLNQLAVLTPTQVNLRVRVAEMSRSVAKELGFNWETVFDNGNFALGLVTGRAPIDAAGNFLRSASDNNPGSYALNFMDGQTNVTSLVDALAEEGIISLMAEPNLTALSGETASFLAGGEFPIPVAQDNERTTIEFKRFGVALDFTPTVLSPERINMRLRPEVSDLTDRGAITLGSIQIPAISVRRAETTVELASGQSFAIAGLLSTNTRSNISKLPGAGDLPIIGPLFQSDRFMQDETELVIIATPYVVQPVSSKTMADPLDGFRPASDVERIFLERLAKPGLPGSNEPSQDINNLRLLGKAGFSY